MYSIYPHSSRVNSFTYMATSEINLPPHLTFKVLKFIPHTNTYTHTHTPLHVCSLICMSILIELAAVINLIYYYPTLS